MPSCSVCIKFKDLRTHGTSSRTHMVKDIFKCSKTTTIHHKRCQKYPIFTLQTNQNSLLYENFLEHLLHFVGRNTFLTSKITYFNGNSISMVFTDEQLHEGFLTKQKIGEKFNLHSTKTLFQLFWMLINWTKVFLIGINLKLF